MTIELGQIVAGFEITGRLGSGGMGDVFRARDLTLGREVAVKVVSADVTARPSRLERLRREARLLAALSHPSVAAIFGLEEVEGTPLLILELIEGPTLHERIRSGPPFGIAEAVRAAAQIASGIGAAHAKGIVHRDLKPANIKLPADGRVKLLDFGIAKALDPSTDESDVADEATVDLTADGAVFGTAPYMSPEQIRGAAVGRANDVWAFGCVLYEMLTGRKAFTNVAAVLEREPDWSRLPADTPREVRTLLQRCLNKDASRRPPDLSESAQMLEDLAVALASGRSGVTHSRDARRWVYGGVAAAAGIAVVMGVLSFTRTTVDTAPVDAALVVRTGNTRVSVAVLPLRNLSGAADNSWVGTALGETISAELRAGDAVRVVPGERVAMMQADLGLPDAEAYTANTLNRVRGILGCDFVVAGGYLISGERVRVDVRVQDARTGDLLVAVNHTGSLADLIDMTNVLGGRLRPALGLANNDSGRVLAGAVMPRSAEAARLYAAGLARLHALDPLGARPLLEQAVTLDPQAPLAQLTLSRVWSSLGYRGRAAEAAKQAFAHSAALPWALRIEIEAKQAELSRDLPAAISLYRQLVDQHPDHLEYGLQLVGAQRAGGQPKESLATLAALRRLPPPLGDDPRIDLEEASSWEQIGDAARALDAAERSIKKADATGARFLLSRAYVALASAQTMRADYPAAKAAALDAQRLAEAVGDKSTVARALRMLGVNCWFLADPDCMVRNSEQGLLIARELGEREGEATSLGNIAIGEILLGRTELALKHELEALAIRIETGDVRSLSTSRHNLGEIYQALGRLDEADASYRQEIVDATAVRNRAAIAAAHSGLGDVAGARGDSAAARTHFETAIAIRTELGLTANVAASQLAMATVLIQAGQPKEAEDLARSAAATFAKVKDRDRESWATGFLARAQLEQGQLAAARATLAPIRSQGERAAYFRARLTFQMNDAAVLAASGQPADVDRARVRLESLLGEAVKNGMVNRQLEVRLELGRVELMNPATAAAGRARLQQLQRDARARGYELIARRAAGLVSASASSGPRTPLGGGPPLETNRG